jgi:peptide/nickel transport system permease protein
VAIYNPSRPSLATRPASLPPAAGGGVELLPPRQASRARLTWRLFRKRKTGLVALFVFGLLVASVILVPMLSPFDIAKSSPFMPSAPAASYDDYLGYTHWLGTDPFGRDLLTRLFVAGQASLGLAVAVTVVILVVGTAIGATAGLYGGWVDALLMRTTDFLLALPVLPMYLFALRIVRSFLQRGANLNDSISDTPTNLLIVGVVLVLFGWMSVARLVRGSTLSLRSRTFIEASRALGAGNGRIIFRHILPNCLAPLIVAGTFAVGDFIILESLLSYFGKGILDPPTPSWGNMLANYQSYAWFLLSLNPFHDIRAWYLLLPALLVFVTVLCLNYIGDALRDALDPRHTT